MMAVASTPRYAHIHSAWEIDDTEMKLKPQSKDTWTAKSYAEGKYEMQRAM